MHTGSLKINIFKVLFWNGGRGVTKKSTLCTLLIMLTIIDYPLLVTVCTIQENCELQRDPSEELAQLQEELVACKLREAEANLSMKELRQKVTDVERHWEVNIPHYTLFENCSGKVIKVLCKAFS